MRRTDLDRPATITAAEATRAAAREHEEEGHGAADALHRPSGRTALGAALALTTVLLWGMLPIGLKVALRGIDPITLTWYRFVAASALLGAVLAWRGTLPAIGRLRRRHWGLLGLATAGLAGNYALYVLGLERTNAATTQVVIQIAPVLLALGSIRVFHERFALGQWIGLVVMVAGMLLFSHEQVAHLLGELDRYYTGVGMVLVAGLSWAAYGLAQKQLLGRMSSASVMLCIYVGCAVLFAPFAHAGSVSRVDTPELAALVFCIVNMLVAYGTFAESLAHLEASRVSALLAIVPLATLVMLEIASSLLPGIVEPEPITGVAVLGAALVVTGSLATTFGRLGR